jgi:transposase
MLSIVLTFREVNTMRVAPEVKLSIEQRQELEKLARGRTVTVRLAQRAKMILMAANGLTDSAIGEELGVSRQNVARWRGRFVERGLTGIEKDAPRPGRKPQISAKQVQQIVHLTTHEKPADATHWSTRSMARATGISPASVRRLWQKHGLKPHLLRTFKLSNDPLFAEKVADIVGLYLNPPEHALVLSVDEKSQVQALDRTQPGLPLKKGRAGTMTHDYKRNGTTTLFAALNILDGKVIADCMPQHRHQEWLKFLHLIDKSTPRRKQLHLIIDNYSPHKHPAVQAWLRRHPRFHIHFTPTSASWLNMVERFFRDITQKQIRRGCFANVAELIETITIYIAQHNTNPKPFIWTAKASDILEKVKRARASSNKFRSV